MSKEERERERENHYNITVGVGVWGLVESFKKLSYHFLKE